MDSQGFKGFDLKAIRERIGKTQSEMAQALGVTQEYISRMEKQPENMSLELFMSLCQLTNMMPNELLAHFRLARPNPLPLPDVYAHERANAEYMKQYVRNKEQELRSQASRISDADKLSGVIHKVTLAVAKPLIGLLGPSDAGKSTLINSITGLDLMLSQWTPTTAAAVYLKHVQDKPSWMGTNEVCIFRAESKEKGWNYRFLDNEAYCQKHSMEIGRADLLKKYCNRNESKLYKEVDAAVVFADADILLGCDLVDLPGFGTEDLNDTVKSQRAREQVDAVIFMCQSNGFFSKHSDVLFLKDTLLHLPVADHAAMPFLSNLLIVASQAHIVKDSLASVLQRGADVLSQQLSEDVIRHYYEVDKAVFDRRLCERFFTYSLDNEMLRKDFEAELQRLLTNFFPNVKRAQMKDELFRVKEGLVNDFQAMEQTAHMVLTHREEAKREYEEKLALKDAKYAEIRSARENLLVYIEKTRTTNILELRLWEKETITEDTIIGIINEKKYDKKRAKEYLVSNVVDLYVAKMQELLKDSAQEFNQMLTQFFDTVHRTAEEVSKVSVGNVDIPFDFKGALAGGIAGASVLGGLGLWAATVGNLGGYILVAKGVSLLSAIGISVGGTAAAASFVALIGGPITIGLALALGIFTAVKFIFGDGWKKSLAKNVAKSMDKEQVLGQYEQAVNRFWNESRTALNEVVESVIQSMEAHLAHIKALIDKDNDEYVTAEYEYASAMRQFSVSIPWNGQE